MAGSAWITSDGSLRVCNGAVLVSDDPCPTVCGGGTTPEPASCCTLAGNPQYGPPQSAYISGGGANTLSAALLSASFSSSNYSPTGGGNHTAFEVSASFSGYPISYRCRHGSGSTAQSIADMTATIGSWTHEVTSAGLFESGNVTRCVVLANFVSYPVQHWISFFIYYNSSPLTSFTLGKQTVSGTPTVRAVSGTGSLSYSTGSSSSPSIYSTWSVSWDEALMSGAFREDYSVPGVNGFTVGYNQLNISWTPKWIGCPSSLLSLGVSPELVSAVQSLDPRIAAAAEAQIRALGIPCCGH